MQQAASRTIPWRGWPGAVMVGLAAPCALAIAADVAHGGLAFVAVAALAAAFVGVPLALAEWRPDEAPAGRGVRDDLRVGARAFARAWGVLAVAALLAPLVAAHGGAGVSVAFVAWVLGTRARSSIGERVAVGLVTSAIAVGAVDAALSTSRAAPWTLLAPQVGSWAAWLPGAVVLGVGLAAPGMGHWNARAALPGAKRAPWLTAGAATLLALAAAFAAAARFEAGGTPDVAMAVVAIAAMAGITVLDEGRSPNRTLASGTVATLWFAGPAAGALTVWWHSAFALGALASAVALAVAARGTDRIVGAVAAGALIAAVITGWRGFPDATSAAALALLVCAGVWSAGAAVLRARGTP